ncbi:MAG TPA: PUA domain-containing protein [Nitrososphaeraceae archaeon]|nr:PUA domain-containing protein [Nitrososphaeraceae archaeon]
MFRKASRQELTVLRRAFDRWGIFGFFEEKTLLIKEDNGVREVYFLSTALERIVSVQQPMHAGLMIGELKKSFLPSMQGADIIARMSKKFPYIIVNEIAEKIILYGRNVLGQSILETAENLKENEIVLMLNINKELIGIGRTKFSGYSLLQENKSTVDTLVDAGSYLRNEGQ